jgi:hypothetical protein
MRHLLLWTSIVLVVLLTPAAHAQPVIVADPATTHLADGLSGRTGLFHIDYHVLDGYAISGLETAETSDRPCRVGIMRKGLPGQHDAFQNYDYGIYGNQQVNQGCPPSIVPTDWIPSRKRAGFFTANNLYVNAAEVCDSKNKNNERIKGLRVFGSRITNSGNVNLAQEQDEFARANCGQWQSRVSCPSNEIATGIRAHFDTDGFVGLQLYCSQFMNENASSNEETTSISQGRVAPSGGGASRTSGSLTWVTEIEQCRIVGCSATKQASLDAAWANLRSQPAQADVSGQYQMQLARTRASASQTHVRIVQAGKQTTLMLEDAAPGLGLRAKTAFQGVLEDDQYKAVAEDGARLDLQLDGQHFTGTLTTKGRDGAAHQVVLKRRR